MSTPHNAGQPGDIAPTAILCGDPLRADYIAKTYLDQPFCYSRVRGIPGWTGSYQGVPVSVQAHGMGIPSIAIYAHELYEHYAVKRILRVGSAGAFSGDVRLGSVVAAMGACTTSAFAGGFGLPGSFAPLCSWSLLERAVPLLRAQGVQVHVGNVLSDDVFYHRADTAPAWRAMGVLAVEMEAAGLYLTAAAAGREALCLLTITAELFPGGRDAEDLGDQSAYDQAVLAALELARGTS